ncbi:hypothetical protein [Micromonospora arborensis]|uniref:hypothetical protein n=1 Tax=Micromonospora arborensis TaxID=2116518 RepID=UPI000DA10D81|nr:hypothetical protein [Micromonospora arborensis]
MGYTVIPSGRLNLPESEDAAAAAAVQAALAGRGEWYEPAAAPSNGTLVHLAEAARASIARDGDWIEFGYDDEGDPKWSDRATAFYVAIAPFARSGIVQIEGEDGARWSYTYADGQITQQGWNGWDGSIEPFGEYADRTGSSQS